MYKKHTSYKNRYKYSMCRLIKKYSNVLRSISEKLVNSHILDLQALHKLKDSWILWKLTPLDTKNSQQLFCVEQCCCFLTSVLTYFCLTKGRVTSFWAETIDASFFHLMKLTYKAMINIFPKSQFVVLHLYALKFFNFVIWIFQYLLCIFLIVHFFNYERYF